MTSSALSDADIDSIANHVTNSDPRALHIPNGFVATLIRMLREAQGELTEIAEAERARQEKWDADVEDWREKFRNAPRDRGVRIMPDGALAWHSRTPDERRAYLTDHRDEAIEYGIPADLVDLMIADAKDGER